MSGIINRQYKKTPNPPPGYGGYGGEIQGPTLEQGLGNEGGMSYFPESGMEHFPTIRDDGAKRTLDDFSGIGETSGDYTGPNYGYIGTRVAPLSGLEQAGLGITPGIAGQYLQAGGGGFDELTKTLRGDYTSTQNPFLKDVLSSSYEALQPYITGEQQRLTGQATLAGQGGGASSPLMTQSRELSENVLNQLASQVANLQFGTYGQERGLQNAAMQQATGYPGQAYNLLTGAGGLQRGIGQAGLDAQYQDFLRMQGLQQGDIDRIMQLLLGQEQQPAQQTQYGPSGFQQLLGPAEAIATKGK